MAKAKGEKKGKGGGGDEGRDPTQPKGVRHGIGEHLAIALAVLFGDPMLARFLDSRGELMSGWWKSDHGKIPTCHPRLYIGPGGSANHKLVAMLVELVLRLRKPVGAKWSGNYHPADPEWTDPRVWFEGWYRVMRDEAHDGFEILSVNYGGAHSIVAMVCAELGIPGAAEHLQRQIALYSQHLTRDKLHPALYKRLIMPGCRSKRDEDPGLELFARYMLGEDKPARRIVGAKGKERVVHGGMEIATARRLNARRWVGLSEVALDTVVLPTVKSAVGTLVHRTHDNGYVSYFETGPRTIGWPIAAVVCVNGREPIILRAEMERTGKDAGKVRGTVSTHRTPDGIEVLQEGRRVAAGALLPLGELVREVRIGPQGGA